MVRAAKGKEPRRHVTLGDRRQLAVDGEALVQWATLIMLAAALLVLVWVVQRKTAVQVREDACM